jgi:ATP-dependent helicase/nuclease subunit A
VVFLCCCDKRGRNDSGGDIFYNEDSGITFSPPLPVEYSRNKDIKPNYFWEYSLAIEKEKKTAELRRLLYVGMTRAENELFLSGCLGISKSLGLESEVTNAPDGDFSRSLKQYIDVKIETAAGKNTIEGDTILEGNTFFGLCLPAFAAHIPEDSCVSPSFFTIEKIPVYSEKDLLETEKNSSGFNNDQTGLNLFFNLAEPFYKDAEIIETPVVPKRHLAPTSLSAETMADKDIPVKDKGFSGEAAADVFVKVDALLDRYAKKDENAKFNYSSFGTIAHICIEALLSGHEAKIPAQLAGLINSKDAETFLSAGRELALRFARSPLGNIAMGCISEGSGKLKNEFLFRSLLYIDGEEIFINGTIDLLFEDAETVHVVDFKTDNQELPLEYIAQMACYHRAASDLFAVPANKKCRIWLYYLRSGHAVEVTNSIGRFSFKDLQRTLIKQTIS